MPDKRESKEKEKICLGVYITKELHSELSAVAQKKEIPISQIVRETLKEYVSKNK